MSSSRRVVPLIAAIPLALIPLADIEGQSLGAVSPFASYVPSASANPIVGMALTFGGMTGLALRGSAGMSMKNPPAVTDSGAGGYRPWAADADAMLFLGSFGGRAMAPYVFAGIGLDGGDSSGVNVVHNGWSYGAGTTLPLGFGASLFGEARWRMKEYVLPTSNMAPSPSTEFRAGLSFHVGGGGSRDLAPESRRRGRRHADEYEVATAPAPYPDASPSPIIVNPPVIVQYPEYPTETVSRVEPINPPLEPVTEPVAVATRTSGVLSRRMEVLTRRADPARRQRDRSTVATRQRTTSQPTTVSRRSSSQSTTVSRRSSSGSSTPSASSGPSAVPRIPRAVTRSRAPVVQQKSTPSARSTTTRTSTACTTSRTRQGRQPACRGKD